MKIVGVEMAKADKPSFERVFPLHLERLLPLVDELYIRVDDPIDEVICYLDDPKITWEPQFPTERFQEDGERQALLDWAFNQDATWMVCLDADEVLEEGAAHVLREFLLSNPPYNGMRLPLTYCSHHRDGYLLDRDETSVSADRIVRLTEKMRGYRYKADVDGLHCGSLPDAGKKTAILKEIITVHYHATTCAEYMAERAFYDGTEEVRKHGGIDLLYACERFGQEKNARPYDEVVVNQEQRFATLMSRIKVPA